MMSPNTLAVLADAREELNAFILDNAYNGLNKDQYYYLVGISKKLATVGLDLYDTLQSQKKK